MKYGIYYENKRKELRCIWVVESKKDEMRDFLKRYYIVRHILQANSR